MSSWEKFSNEIVEGKKKPVLDPVGKEDADINNDGKENETDSYLKNRRKIRSRIIRKEDYENIEEKSVSKSQQRFFGMVRAAQKGEMEDPSPEVSKAAASMSKSDVKDFAKTKHSKLPEKKETKEETSLVDDIVENLRAQRLARSAQRQVAQDKQARRKTARQGQDMINDLVKGPNPSRGKSKRTKVKAPANVKGGSKKSSDGSELNTPGLRADERRRASLDNKELRKTDQALQARALDAAERAETSRTKEASDSAKERADQRSAAARENEVKRAKELKSSQIDAKEKQKSAFGDVFKKEVGDAANKIGSRASVKKDDTGGQALRNIDVAGDAAGGLVRGLVKGALAKRQAKKDRIADVQKQRSINNAGRRAGKEFDSKERAKSDAQSDMADAGLEKLTGMKPGDKVKTEKPSEPKQIKGTEVKGALPSKGQTGTGSDQAKDARQPGGKSRAVPFKPPTPPAQQPAIPMGGASPKRPALPPAKSGSSATSGGARIKSPGQVARDKKKNAPKEFRDMVKKTGPDSIKRSKPQGFGDSFDFGYSNWRAELNEGFFLQEVEDVENNGLHSSIKKLVDISKKKNKIEINPPLGEGAIPVKPIVGSFAQGEAGKGDSNRTMGDVAKRRIRRKLVDWASQKAGEKAEDVVKDILSKKKEGDEVKEDWQKVNRKDKTDGLSQKAVNAYRKENPGSKLQTAVTEKKPTGKRADRRKSFCRRMKGMKAKLTSKKTSRDPDSRINKALRRWNCN